jgi:hypothetical protein
MEMAKRANGFADFTFNNHVLKWVDGKRVAEYDLMRDGEYSEGDDYARNVWRNGIKQRIIDSAAGVDDKIGAVIETVANLKNRIYSTGRTGSSDLSILVAAILEFDPTKTESRVREWVGALKPTQQRAMAASDNLKSIIARIRDERTAATGIDGNALLESMPE